MKMRFFEKVYLRIMKMDVEADMNKPKAEKKPGLDEMWLLMRQLIMSRCMTE